MAIVDNNAPVMVTGATGFVAGWLVKKLLEQGYTVHAPIRNISNAEKRAHLDRIAEKASGEIKYFEADLLKVGSYAKAMEGCELVYHTASPFTMNYKDPQKDLVDPAVKGTENILTSANRTTSVKRVVVTSSVAAIYTDAIDCQKGSGGMLTESMWNTTASLDYQPYSYSKTLAEKKAWEIAKAQDQYDLVTVNPSFVMGPALNPETNTSESHNVLQQLGDGTMKMGVPKMGVGVVDVRDVAEAHYLAGFTPKAEGRYITSGHNTDFLEMALMLQPKFGEKFPIPSKALPKWLLMLVGPLVDKRFSRKFLKNNVNIKWKADNSKIKKELGLTFRPLQTSMEDAFQTLVDTGIVRPK